MYNIKPGQLVEIHWIDPSVGSHWADPNEISACRKVSVKSVGWVYLMDDVGVVLAASYESDGDKQTLLRQHLPWGCIQDIWRFGD